MNLQVVLTRLLARRQSSTGILAGSSGCRQGCRRYRSALLSGTGLQKFVIPAKAGIQYLQTPGKSAAAWMPVYTGMTVLGFSRAEFFVRRSN